MDGAVWGGGEKVGGGVRKVWGGNYVVNLHH